MNAIRRYDLPSCRIQERTEHKEEKCTKLRAEQLWRSHSITGECSCNFPLTMYGTVWWNIPLMRITMIKKDHQWFNVSTLISPNQCHEEQWVKYGHWSCWYLISRSYSGTKATTSLNCLRKNNQRLSLAPSADMILKTVMFSTKSVAIWFRPLTDIWFSELKAFIVSNKMKEATQCLTPTFCPSPHPIHCTFLPLLPSVFYCNCIGSFSLPHSPSPYNNTVMAFYFTLDISPLRIS